MKKYINFLFLCITIFFLTSEIYVHAETQEEKNQIIAISHEKYNDLSLLPTLKIIQNNTKDDTQLVNFLFEFGNVSATVLRTDGTTDTISLGIRWDCFFKPFYYIDYATLGLYQETGQILLPNDTYEFSEDVLSTLTIPVEIIVPEEPIVITEFDESSIINESYAITKDSDLSYILDSASPIFSCMDTNGLTHLAKVVWDNSSLDLSVPGVYKITGIPALPMHAVASDDLVFPESTITFSVQEEGKPDINCFSYGRGYISFPWVTPPGDLEKISVWISENDGEWEQLNEDSTVISPSSLRLKLYALNINSTYKLQVDYEGGQTGILSFSYNDEIEILEYNQGDRDGGDAGLTPPPEEDTKGDTSDKEEDTKDDNPPTENKPSNNTTDSVISVQIEKKPNNLYNITIVENGVITEIHTNVSESQTESIVSEKKDNISLNNIHTEISTESSVTTSNIPAVIFIVLLIIGITIILFCFYKRRKRLC